MYIVNGKIIKVRVSVRANLFEGVKGNAVRIRSSPRYRKVDECANAIESEGSRRRTK